MNARVIVGAIIILIGLSSLFDFPFLRFLFPLLIIWFGLRIITGKTGGFNMGEKSETQEEKINKVVIFSSLNEAYSSNNFRGGEIVIVFGGGEIDLTNAKAKDEVKLNLVAILGGVKVIVPNTWLVKSNGIGILGGFSNKTKVTGKKTAEVRIEGVAIFGGV